MADNRDDRLEALELKLMEFEVTQNELDAVVIRQGAEIDRLKKALEAALSRLESSGAAGDAGSGAEQTSLAHELPPHY